MGDDRRRAIRIFWALAFVCAAVAAAGLLGLDGAAARWASTLPAHEAIWENGTIWLDTALLKPLSNFLLGAILLVVAGGLMIDRSARRIARPLLYVGAVQFSSTIVADLAKPWFGRLRPFEAATAGTDTWFAGANSFPSGHEAFYAGLFLPLMLIFPRWALAFAVPPLFIAAARIAEHDHYPSDVAVSAALAALSAIAFSFILAGNDRPSAPEPEAAI